MYTIIFVNGLEVTQVQMKFMCLWIMEMKSCIVFELNREEEMIVIPPHYLFECSRAYTVWHTSIKMKCSEFVWNIEMKNCIVIGYNCNGRWMCIPLFFGMLFGSTGLTYQNENQFRHWIMEILVKEHNREVERGSLLDIWNRKKYFFFQYDSTYNENILYLIF